MRCSAYLTNLFTRLDDVINWNVEQLLPHVGEFDAIAFRGMSGAMVAPAVATRLNKPFILVRKPGDSSHSEYRVEGEVHCRRYVIIDDLIASGSTVRTIQEEIAQVSHGAAACVGIVLWQEHSVYWRAEVEKERGWSARYFENFAFPHPPAELLNGQCKALEKCTATQVREEMDRFTPRTREEAIKWYSSRIGGGYDEAVWKSQYPPREKLKDEFEKVREQANLEAIRMLAEPILFKRPSSLAQSFAQFIPDTLQGALEPLIPNADYGDAKALGTWKEITGQDLTAEANTAVGPGGGPENT